MGPKKTIKLVKKVLQTPNKRSMYTPEELTYMEKQLDLMILQRQRAKLKKKGFLYG